MICVGLGSNVGSREAYLLAAELLVASGGWARVEVRSSLYATAAVGPDQPDYLNAVLRLETALHPRELLPRLLSIETQLGRVRRERWGPRVVDLDILFWSGGEVHEPGLDVPHPRLAERPFAMAPLLDVAPELAAVYRCEPPARRAWSSSPAHALDALDALALATTAALGRPAAARAVEPFEHELPREGPALVVIERWDERGRRGRALRGP